MSDRIPARKTWCGACDMWHRSRLEADTHMAFDRAGVAAIYEPCAYTVTGYARSYLPDFAVYPFILDGTNARFLPALVEAKPTWEIAFASLATGKLQSFARDVRSPVVILVPGGHRKPMPVEFTAKFTDVAVPMVGPLANALLLDPTTDDLGYHTQIGGYSEHGAFMPLLVRPNSESGQVFAELRPPTEIREDFWEQWN